MAALALVAACSGDDDGPTAATSTTIPPPDTVVRIGVEDWPDCVNPLTCADDALRETVLQHVLPAAMEMGVDGQYAPSTVLAGEPEVAPGEEGTVTITYELADEARWADGRPITSSDFLGTWQAVMATPGSDRTGYDRIVSVDDADPSIVVVTLDGPLVDWQELFGGARGFLMRADSFGAGPDLTGQFEEELPMSAGPYQLASWSSERAVLAATQPLDSRPRPEIDQVRLDRVVSDAVEDPMSYDMLVPADSSQAEVPDGFEVRTTPSTRVLGVWFDQRSPLLQPVDHRRTITALFDMAALREAADAGTGVSCPGWVPALGPWCEAAETTPPAPPADTDVVDLARFVLAGQGWVPGEDGVLVRGEERFQLTVSHDPATPGAAAVAEELAPSLEEIGIEVMGRPATTADWLATRTVGSPTGIGVYAFDMGASPRVDDLYGCPDGARSSVVASCPSDVVALVDGLGRSTRTAALEAVATIASRVSEEVLWLPLVIVDDRFFLRPGRLLPPESVAAPDGPLGRLELFAPDS